MNKRSWFYCCGCLIVGLAVGYFYAEGSAGRVAANAFALVEFTDLAGADERAFQAYQHESNPVAIYALSEALDKEKTAEQFGGEPYMSRRMISVDLFLTHARLAKLYGESGQTNLSAQHIAEALKYAREANSSEAITNEAALMELLAKFDEAGNDHVSNIVPKPTVP